MACQMHLKEVPAIINRQLSTRAVRFRKAKKSFHSLVHEQDDVYRVNCLSFLLVGISFGENLKISGSRISEKREQVRPVLIHEVRLSKS